MGTQTTMFNCPHCKQGPNWSLVDGIALHGSLVVLVCPNVQCQKVIGTTHVASRR